MFIAIFRLLGLAAMIVVPVIWIISLVNFDGHCHSEDCDGCPLLFHDCPDSQHRNEGGVTEDE